jgi:autophagy-related protein 2
MSFSQWYNSISDAFKKRAGRYLINRYLGTFLDETISLDQLSIDGAISLNNVALNISTINSMIDEADLPVEFVDGYIQDLSVTIPWSNLLNESCLFNIEGLTITLQVKKRANPAQISASIFHSMCESFSSFHVAEDCIKQGDVESSPGKTRRSRSEEDMVAGVELLAQAIDSVIMRVQVKLTNTVVRLEYLPVLEQQGVAVELHVASLVYRGQAGQEEDSFSTSTLSKIKFEDVSLYTDEFNLEGRKSMYTSHNLQQSSHQNLESEPPLILASLAGSQELLLRFTEMNQFGLPRAVDEVQLNLGALKLHVFPHQVKIFNLL